jgi:hypothetical protein
VPTNHACTQIDGQKRARLRRDGRQAERTLVSIDLCSPGPKPTVEITSAIFLGQQTLLEITPSAADRYVEIVSSGETTESPFESTFGHSLVIVRLSFHNRTIPFKLC